MYSKYIKRILDFLLAFIGIVVLAPVLIVLTVLGFIKMKGNPFFFQDRPGKDGKIFKLIKFKTMFDIKDQDGNILPDSERLSKYGLFLRKSSLDELPELFNILKGDMAIVGPRPLLVKYLPLYSDRQKRRHEVRPGLTGLAQVNGRNLVSWEKRFEYDVEYVDNISFLLDLKIIIKTAINVIRREGISSRTTITMEEFKGNNE